MSEGLTKTDIDRIVFLLAYGLALKRFFTRNRSQAEKDQVKHLEQWLKKELIPKLSEIA